MEIFIIREGRQAGPFSEDAVKAFLTEGTARPADMGWAKGMAEWRPLSEVLKPSPERLNGAAANGTAPKPPSTSEAAQEAPATAKQKAFLKYLGAEFGENLTKQRAALAVSDALETPKLQPRIRKWQDDKLRMHSDIFQDEIDYRRANRTNRYLERIQTEGADVLKDVTKAHVQVLVETLDKKNPGWESNPEAALWDHLLPAIGGHFPQLVRPAHKHLMKSAAGSRIARAATRGLSAAAGVVMPRPQTGTLGAMLRGVILGVIALGGILVGHHYWQKSRGDGTSVAPASPEKKETPPASVSSGDQPPKNPAPKESALEPPGKLIAENKLPELPPEKPAPSEPVPAPPAANDPPAPAPAMNAEKPAAPAVPEEKPAVPPAAPAMTPEAPVAPAAVTPPPAPVPRTSVTLVQNIGIMLQNGQVTLPAGTVLRYLAIEGANVRVSWNNNIFFVPAAATNVNEPVAAPAEPGMAPAAPGTQPPAAPAASEKAKPKKPSDDL